MQTKVCVKIMLRSSVKFKENLTSRRFAEVMLWKGLSLQSVFGCRLAVRARGMFCTEIINLLIFPFADALFPKDFLAPALIWRSTLTLVEPTEIQGSRARWGCFCFVASSLAISFTPAALKLICLWGRTGSPGGNLTAQRDGREPALWGGGLLTI